MNGNAGRAVRAVVGLAGAVMVAAVIVRYPPPAELPLDPRPLLAFDPTKVWPLARALLGLLALNLAMWGLGRPLQRRLRSTGSLTVPEALGFGFVALADVTLLFAAARSTRRRWRLWFGRAGLGAYLLWREHRGWRPRRPGWAWLAVAVLLVSPLWAPGWTTAGTASPITSRSPTVPVPQQDRGHALFPHTAFRIRSDAACWRSRSTPALGEAPPYRAGRARRGRPGRSPGRPRPVPASWP
jgi:hypothetical protein